MQEKSKDKDVDGYGKRLLKQAELFKKFALPNTDDEYTSDSENEYDHHPEEEFLDEEESEFNAQEAWNNACENYGSDDEDTQQVPYQSRGRGKCQMRKVVPLPPKARSCRPKEPHYARPFPTSSYPDVSYNNPGSYGNYGCYNDQEFYDDAYVNEFSDED